MVPHSARNDTLAIEQGIDAVPESDGIYLAWYSLRDPDIRYYRIYRRREDETFFRRIRTIDLETATTGKDTTYIDDNAEAGLALNVYYYYFVTAVNMDGIEGLAADTLRYKLIDKPQLERPDGETYDPDVDGLPTLFWRFVNIPDLFILRIENIFNQVQYIGIFQSNYDNNAQILELSGLTELPEFQPGTYLWRIDSIGPDADHSGAEADWLSFIIN